MSFVAYWPALDAGYVWDDDAYLTKNPHLLDAAGLADIWLEIGATKMYVPMVFTTFWVEYRLWGLDPLGYHAVNIALHGLGAVLLWILLRRLALPGAWLGAALFATHPVFVESVAWITELKNTLSTIFALLSLLAYFRWAPMGSSGRPRGRNAHYAMAIAFFAAALLSKPVVVGLPLVILALVWWRNGRIARADVAAVAPMLLLSLAAGLVAIYVEATSGGAASVDWRLPLTTRLLVAGRALWFYVGKLAWPAELLPIYPRWEVGDFAAWQLLFPLAAFGAAVALWLGRARWGRGPLTAAAAFAILTAPLVGFFDVSYFLHSFVADHFQHHGAPALLALGAAGIASLHSRWKARSPWLLPGASAVIVALLALASARYAPAFASEEARCRAVLAGNPGSWLAMNNLGAALNARGAFAESIPWLERAIAAREPYPEARNNLGVAYVGLGRPEEAILQYRTSLDAFPENPLAHNNLGTALARSGRVEEAIASYREALRLAPDYAEARSNLALVTESAEARNHRGRTFAASGKLSEALAEFRAAVTMEPDFAPWRNDLGTALAASGDLAGALREFGEAVRLAPDDAAARANLGRALLAAGRPSEAIDHFSQVARLKPTESRAYTDLGAALAESGRTAEAVTAFERAVALAPDDRDAHEDLLRARAIVGSGS